MPTLPPAIIAVVAPFAPVFSGRVWRHAQVLLAGTILASAHRTVAAALRAMGLAQAKQFHRYHRVLSHARWSGLAAGRVLLRLLVAAFVPDGPLVFGVDETLERRRGAKIAAKGIYRDAVRSSHSHFAKASGLRWVCLMLLAPVPWAGRVWALPCLTALAPSEGYDAKRGRRHKTLTDWARQLLRIVRRWWPDRPLVAVADSTYAALAFLAACGTWRRPVTVVTRLRLDAGLYEPAPPRRAGQVGRPRVKGPRLPTLAARLADPTTRWTSLTVANWYGAGERTVEIVSATAVWYHSGLPPVPLRWVLIRDPHGRFDPQALLCTDSAAEPAQILAWFVWRWQLEVTFEEARRHLGLETQRQWSEVAIRRTTPALLGLFSLVTLLAQPRLSTSAPAIRQAAWYRKPRPTFADALAVVRRDLWWHQVSHASAQGSDSVKLPRRVVDHLTETLRYAA
ncbi:MAG TPA: transposase [Actinomycetes bacterium]|nr:transposase [Actinomycetes bacterium]